MNSGNQYCLFRQMVAGLVLIASYFHAARSLVRMFITLTTTRFVHHALGLH